MFKRQIDVIAYDDSTGKAYILVDHKDGTNSLICRGTFNRYCGINIDKLTLEIYNLSPDIIGNIASNYNNYKIKVSFGYEDDDIMFTLFEGNLMRIINQRDDEVTNKTTFYIYDSGDFSTYGFYSGAFEDGVNYYQIAKALCGETIYDEKGNDISGKATYKVTNSLDEKLKQYTVKGSLVFYNQQIECLQQIADETNNNLVISGDNVTIFNKNNSDTEEIVIFTQMDKSNNKVESISGLIGIPTLESDGLSFKCLINPKISIYGLVLIDNSIISVNQTGVIPSRDWGAQLDPDNLYRVMEFSGTFTNDGGECSMDIRGLSRYIYDGI